jgi:hypothetical protein
VVLFGWRQLGRQQPLKRDCFKLKHNHALASRLSMIFAENRFPPRIKSGAGFFGIKL